jgi:hypothetical protein
LPRITGIVQTSPKRSRCLNWVNRVVLTVGQPLPVHADQRTFAGYVGTSNVPKAYRNIRVADRESRRLEVGAAITEPRPKPIRQGLLDALRLL